MQADGQVYFGDDVRPEDEHRLIAAERREARSRLARIQDQLETEAGKRLLIDRLQQIAEAS
jgi:hypothetical protein